MSRLGRFAAIVCLLGLLFVLPSANATAGTGAGTGPRTPATENLVSIVPGGAQVKALGPADLMTWNTASGATLIAGSGCSGIMYSNTPFDLRVPFGLPAGAVLWQVDVYGCAPAATTQQYYLMDQNSATNAFTSDEGVTTTSGPGIVHGAMAFPGGLTLASGHNWALSIPHGDATNGFFGAIIQYTLPSAQLYPINPVRVYDSRFATKMANGEKRTIDVKNAIDPSTGAVTGTNVIPVGARAVSFTVTVTQTSGAGWVAALPGGSTTVTVSTVNWTTSGADIAAGSIVTLGAGANERQITLALGGRSDASSHVIIDVTGYYM